MSSLADDIALGGALAKAQAVKLVDTARPVAVFKTNDGASLVYKGCFINPSERALIAATGFIYEVILNRIKSPYNLDFDKLFVDLDYVYRLVYDDQGSLQSDASTFRRKTGILAETERKDILHMAGAVVALALQTMQRDAFRNGLVPAFAVLPERMGLMLADRDGLVAGERMHTGIVGWGEWHSDDAAAEAELEADALEMLTELNEAGFTDAAQVAALLDGNGI